MKFQRGKPKTGGRQKGTPNRASAEVKMFWGSFFESDGYRENLKGRILRGKAPEMEKYLLQLIYGKPREAVGSYGLDDDRGPSVVVYLPQKRRHPSDGRSIPSLKTPITSA